MSIPVRNYDPDPEGWRRVNPSGERRLSRGERLFVDGHEWHGVIAYNLTLGYAIYFDYDGEPLQLAWGTIEVACDFDWGYRSGHGLARPG